MRKALFIVGLCGIMLTACSQSGKTVTATQFEKGLKEKEIQILDVRTLAEYNKGHIKDALLANWNEQEEFKRRVSFLNKEKPVYVYCQAGGRSAAANSWLTNNGFKKVVELSGGMINWLKENKAVEGATVTTQFTKADFDKMISQKDIIYLVDFGATWCAPCVQMKPIIDDMVATHKGKFTLINIDAGVHINLQKEMSVETLPTFIVYKNGVVLMRFEGLTTKEQLVKVMFP